MFIYEPQLPEELVEEVFLPLPEGESLEVFGKPSDYFFELYALRGLLYRMEREEAVIRLIRCLARHGDSWRMVTWSGMEYLLKLEAAARAQQPDADWPVSSLVYGPRRGISDITIGLNECQEHGWIGITEDYTAFWPKPALLERLQPQRKVGTG